jgi:hypothetical protein
LSEGKTQPWTIVLAIVLSLILLAGLAMGGGCVGFWIGLIFGLSQEPAPAGVNDGRGVMTMFWTVVGAVAGVVVGLVLWALGEILFLTLVLGKNLWVRRTTIVDYVAHPQEALPDY